MERRQEQIGRERRRRRRRKTSKGRPKRREMRTSGLNAYMTSIFSVPEINSLL